MREAVETGGVTAAAMIYHAMNARLGRLQPAPVAAHSGDL
jgi:hypothetical protein